VPPGTVQPARPVAGVAIDAMLHLILSSFRVAFGFVPADPKEA
jgi:hypothetical protein